MSTLALLKAEIADDLARSDLTSQIASAISSAIAFYKPGRFFFNETRDATFATVADQSRYTSDDDADIPLFLKLDGVFLEDDGQSYWLHRNEPVELESLLDGNATGGRPVSYAYFNRSFWLYPVPDGVYTVRPIGQIEKAAPASDAETGNVWMTNAYELIRCRAKRYLFQHIIKDPAQASMMGAFESKALASLMVGTTQRVASGMIRKTEF